MLTWWSSVGARDTHMLRFHELQHNPVSVACRDESGATYEVVAMRLRGGMVKMTCQCQHYSQEGWCNHCLAVFCDRDVFQDDKHREAFDRLVGATYLQEAAEKLIKALDIFAVAYKQMKSVRPSQVNRGQLKKFAGQAYYAGSSADDWSWRFKELSMKLRLVTPPNRSRSRLALHFRKINWVCLRWFEGLSQSQLRSNARALERA